MKRFLNISLVLYLNVIALQSAAQNSGHYVTLDDKMEIYFEADKQIRILQSNGTFMKEELRGTYTRKIGLLLVHIESKNGQAMPEAIDLVYKIRLYAATRFKLKLKDSNDPYLRFYDRRTLIWGIE